MRQGALRFGSRYGHCMIHIIRKRGIVVCVIWFIRVVGFIRKRWFSRVTVVRVRNPISQISDPRRIWYLLSYMSTLDKRCTLQVNIGTLTLITPVGTGGRVWSEQYGLKFGCSSQQSCTRWFSRLQPQQLRPFQFGPVLFETCCRRSGERLRTSCPFRGAGTGERLRWRERWAWFCLSYKCWSIRAGGKRLVLGWGIMRLSSANIASRPCCSIKFVFMFIVAFKILYSGPKPVHICWTIFGTETVSSIALRFRTALLIREWYWVIASVRSLQSVSNSRQSLLMFAGVFALYVFLSRVQAAWAEAQSVMSSCWSGSHDSIMSIRVMTSFWIC